MQSDAETLWIITLDTGTNFVWRPPMTCLVPFDAGKLVVDLKPGDRVLFNNLPCLVTEIRVYR
jgi:hypothetical protein